MKSRAETPFERALIDATLEEYSDVPDCEDKIAIQLSDHFIRKTEKLNRKTVSKGWKYQNTVWKRVALIAILAAVLAASAMAIPAVREAIIKFFLHDEGTHYEVSFDPIQAASAPDSIETVYLPTYIPDGYQQEFKTVSIAAVSIGWHNANNWWICFDQVPMPEDYENATRGGINSEGATAESTGINGFEVIKITDNEVITYIWTNHEYMFTLMCEKEIPESEMLKIFSSVQADDLAQGIVRHADLRFLQAVFRELARQQMVARDAALLLVRIGAELDDLHTVEERTRDGVGRVGRRDEHALAQVERNFEEIIPERCVLLRIEHLEQGG